MNVKVLRTVYVLHMPGVKLERLIVIENSVAIFK